MKPRLLALGLALLAAFGTPSRAVAAEVNPAAQPLDQAIQSKDAKQIVGALPAIEKLWPQNPEAYFASVKNAAGALDATTADPGTRCAISNLFSSMIEKAVSNSSAAAVPNLAAKDEAVLYFLNFREVREDPTNLLALARYIGTLRGQIIPGFVPKPVSVNPPGLMDATPEEAQQILQQNQQNIAENNWQQSLATANAVLTFHLLHNAAGLTARTPGNIGFIQDLTMAARLTEGEQRQLK